MKQSVGNKNSGQPYQVHLSGKDDLITSHAETRAGFLALALEKNRHATPFVAEARALNAAASLVAKPADLVRAGGLQAAMVAAAGISDKAARHIDAATKEQVIRDFITNFLDPAGEDWVDELVYRFLITRGETVGGSLKNIGGAIARLLQCQHILPVNSLKNIGGAIAQRKLTRNIIAALSLANITFEWHHAKSKKWLIGNPADPDIEFQTNALSWTNAQGIRTLRYNYSPQIVNKNVDLCLLACSPQTFKTAAQDASLYVALGELKGGIDPAGADEHWKTARTALLRIRESFSLLGFAPASLFIGAAIVSGMAHEIWTQLGNGTLTNAANLTVDTQLASVCHWIINL